MSNVTLLAVDLSKNIFQLHGIDAKSRAVLKKKLKREKLLEFMAKLNKCKVYMEACGSSNYWGRRFIELGHKVKLINPKYVKPFVKRNKNDEKDAEAIAVAAMAPGMNFCDVKTEAYQDMQSTHRIRSSLIQQRTALTNRTHGLLAEYGIFMLRGSANIRMKLPEILGNNPNNLSKLMLINITTLYNDLQYLDKQIAFYDQTLKDLCRNDDLSKRMAGIPGVGVLGATILVAMLTSGSIFKNGRHFAAFLGLTPKQHSSGGKEVLLGISKRGDSYARTILIQGAQSVLFWSNKKTDRISTWVKKLQISKCKNQTAVALANKIARIAWSLVYHGKDYDPNYKPTIKYRSKRKVLKVA